MPEHFENQVVEPGDGLNVSADAEAMRKLFPEFFNEEKPSYDLVEADSLTAYIQFDSFPDEVFLKFLVDYYALALSNEVVSEYYERLNTQKVEYNFLWSSDPEDDPVDLNEVIVEPIYSKRKIAWAGGIVFEKDRIQTEVVRVAIQNRVKVKVGVKMKSKDENEELELSPNKQAKMALLDEILTRFELNGETYQPVKIIECSCERCRKADSRPYEISYHHFETLQKIFAPEIQCYASGEMFRLDEISPVPQPEVRFVVLHADADLPFFEEFYEFFKKQGNFKIELWEQKKLLGQPRPLEEILNAVNHANMVVFMTSVDFDNSEVIYKGAERALERFKTGDIRAKAIQLKSFDWHDHPLFKKSTVEALNSEPIELASNRAEAWQKIAKQVHRDIEEWVKVLGKRSMG